MKFWLRRRWRRARPGSPHINIYLYRDKFGFEAHLPGGGAVSCVRFTTR